MSWWSTVIGGAVGFMIGGPLGAMLGVAFAGNFSKRRANSGFNGNFGPGNQQQQEKHDSAHADNHQFKSFQQHLFNRS